MAGKGSRVTRWWENKQWGCLGSTPRHHSLAAWRQSFARDTLLGARQACWEEAHLAWVEATTASGSSRRTPPPAELGDMPIWVYAGSLVARFGEGIWTDGLHIWVSEQALAQKRAETCLIPTDEDDPRSVETPALVTALLACAEQTPAWVQHATGSSPHGRPWPEVRVAMAEEGFGDFVDALPEKSWSMSDIQNFWTAPAETLSPAESSMWEEYCALPPGEKGELPPPWAALNPYSAPCLRRLQGIWRYALKTIKKSKPAGRRAWLRCAWVWWQASAHPKTPWLRAAGMHKIHGMVDINDEPQFIACVEHAAAWLPPESQSWAKWGMHTFTPWTDDYVWNHSWACVRDGAEPWVILPETGKSPLDAALKTWGHHRTRLRSWLKLWSPPGTPVWWKYPAIWNQTTGKHGLIWLLDHGADVNARFSMPFDPYRHILATDDRTPLHKIDRWSWDADLVRRFVAAGADPNAQDAGGYTPLFMADDDALILALLEGGADPRILAHAQSHRGVTQTHSVLTYHLEHGLRLDAATLDGLIKAGADPTYDSGAGCPPFLRLPQDANFWEKATIVNLHQAMVMFKGHGVSPLSTDSQGNTALHVLAEQAGVHAKNRATLHRLVAWLLDEGCLAHQPNLAGDTPLDLAARSSVEPSGAIMVKGLLKGLGPEHAPVVDQAWQHALGTEVGEALLDWKVRVQVGHDIKVLSEMLPLSAHKAVRTRL